MTFFDKGFFDKGFERIVNYFVGDEEAETPSDASVKVTPPVEVSVALGELVNKDFYGNFRSLYPDLYREKPETCHPVLNGTVRTPVEMPALAEDTKKDSDHNSESIEEKIAGIVAGIKKEAETGNEKAENFLPPNLNETSSTQVETAQTVETAAVQAGDTKGSLDTNLESVLIGKRLAEIQERMNNGDKKENEKTENFPAPDLNGTVSTEEVSYPLIELNGFRVELDDLLNSIKSDSATFSPLKVDLNHPIHHGIYNLAALLISKYGNESLKEKILHFEVAIEECRNIAGKIPGSNLNLDEFETGLRYHFYHFLLSYSEKEFVENYFKENNKFPSDLSERENALGNLATKNGNYPNSLYMAPVLLGTALSKVVDSCLQEAANKVEMPLTVKTLAELDSLIAKKMVDLGLTNQSQCASFVDFSIREALRVKLTNELVSYYKKQFQETGSVDIFQLQEASNNLKVFNRFDLPTHPKIPLLGQIFELGTEKNPFAQARAKVEEQKKASLNKLTPQLSVRLLKYFKGVNPEQKRQEEQKKQEIETRAETQLKTLSLAESMWNGTLPLAPSMPAAAPIPTAPAPTAPRSFHFNIASLEVKKVQAPSYLDISFAALLDSGKSDQEIWNELPALNKKDALRHVRTLPNSIQGKTENIARRIFSNVDTRKIGQEINKLPSPSYPVNPGLSESEAGRRLFREKAEKVLDLYYSMTLDMVPSVLQKFRALPVSKEPLFLKYVNEIANASGIAIDDHSWAEYHWSEDKYFLISLQALEKCLHEPAEMISA